MRNFNNLKAVPFFVNSDKIKLHACLTEAYKLKAVGIVKLDKTKLVTIWKDRFLTVYAEYGVTVGNGFISYCNDRIFNSVAVERIGYAIARFTAERL